MHSFSNKNKRQVIYLAFFFTSFLGFAQQSYFQQKLDYVMDVKLNDKLHSISATQTITYVNNSPTTLTYLYFHLWPNAYKNNSTALAKQLLKNGETSLYYFAQVVDYQVYLDSIKPAR